jgi:CRP-like cAMP-binding protein
MADNRKVELLRQVPLFTRCTGNAIDLIAQIADEVDVPAGAKLMQQGELGHQFFFIADGRIRIDRDGRELKMLGPGDYFGEVALLDEGHRTASATAETAAKLLVIDHRGFNSLMDSSVEIRASILKGLVDKIRVLAPEVLS